MSDVITKLPVVMIAASIVFLLARLDIGRKAGGGGWRHLRPGAMHWTGVLLGSALFFLMAYVWLFVGSKRPDGEQQMRILFWLMIAFGSGSIAGALSMHAMRRAAVRWRGNTIAFSGRDGVARVLIGQAQAIRGGMFGYTIVFDGGEAVRIDPYATNAPELLDLINEQLSARQH